MKIYIDSACDILYCSYYIKGIHEYWGKANVEFRSKPFEKFKFNNHFFAFTLNEKNKKSKRIIIDYADSAKLNQIAFEWADLYCKINIDPSMNITSKKLISIGPGFGIKLYSLPKTIYLCIFNYLRSYQRIHNPRLFFSNYKALFQRVTLDTYYQKTTENDDYIYFVASIWKKEKHTNLYRSNFIKACLSKVNMTFEGGFAPRKIDVVSGFEELTMKDRQDLKTYIRKTKKSILTFNTPAVLDCHGWKLAEFLCLGKAIISTPLTRKLPKHLKDSEHFLITEGSIKDIKEKIDILKNNTQLREDLKKNAKKYYEEVLSPKVVMKKIEKHFW